MRRGSVIVVEEKGARDGVRDVMAKCVGSTELWIGDESQPLLRDGFEFEQWFGRHSEKDLRQNVNVSSDCFSSSAAGGDSPHRGTASKRKQSAFFWPKRLQLGAYLFSQTPFTARLHVAYIFETVNIQ